MGNPFLRRGPYPGVVWMVVFFWYFTASTKIFLCHCNYYHFDTSKKTLSFSNHKEYKRVVVRHTYRLFLHKWNYLRHWGCTTGASPLWFTVHIPCTSGVRWATTGEYLTPIDKSFNHYCKHVNMAATYHVKNEFSNLTM